MNLFKSEIYFDELVHGYISPDGQVLSGVTSVLKEVGLAPNYSNIDPSVLAAAASRGTAIHQLLEQYDNGEVVVVEEDAILIKEYTKMLDKHNLQVVCSEYLVNDKYIASKIDKVLADGSLADIKTTSKVHTTYVRWQLSIYKYLFELMNPSIVVPHLYVFHCHNGKFKCIEVEPIDISEVLDMLHCWINGKPYIRKTTSILPADLTQELCSIVDAIHHLDELLAQLNAEKQAIIDKIEDEIAKEGEIDLGDYIIKYSAPYERTSIDSVKLKKDKPEIFEKYSKTSIVKGNISIKIK